MRGIKANTPGIDSVVLSAHCHNDLGQAASNTLMGAGSSHVCTVGFGPNLPQ